jgi:2'-5' RNA ligase
LIARVKELLDKLYNRRLLIRLVGVKFSHLVGGGQQINMFEDRVEILNLYYAMDKLRLTYGEDKIQRAVSLNTSLRGFNPFNGINSSPATLHEAGDNENTIMPSIRSINTLFNLNSTAMKNQNQSAASPQQSVKVYEYLLLISPPSSIKNEVMGLKEDFNNMHQHVQAIKSQPRITLINFLLSDVEEESLLYKIDEVARCHPPFMVELKNFNQFKTHTIYIDVENPSRIVNLLRSLQATLNLPSSRSFFAWKPHMTVAKGLTEENCYKAMAEFKKKEFSASFIADSMVLMKHEGRFTRYEVVSAFEFGN